MNNELRAIGFPLASIEPVQHGEGEVRRKPSEGKAFALVEPDAALGRKPTHTEAWHHPRSAPPDRPAQLGATDERCAQRVTVHVERRVGNGPEPTGARLKREA